MILSNKPFFSILLPTKNRSEVVGNAILSVLNQSYINFELIVSDNDDPDLAATYTVVNGFKDSRIKYFRTSGDLSMPDNWNNALSKASGIYVTVLQDKQIYHEGALDSLHQNLISQREIEVITFQSDMSVLINKDEFIFNNNNKDNLWAESSQVILSDLVKYGPFSIWNRLPRMINSCVSHELIKRTSKTTNLPSFFIDVTPDLSASFIQLAMTKTIYHMDASLVISTSTKLSGGMAVRKRSQSGESFFNGVSKQGDICSLVQIKNRHVVSNLIVNDYLNVREILRGKLEVFIFSNENYLKIYLNDVARNFSEGYFFIDTIKDAHSVINKYPFLFRVRMYTYFLLMFVRCLVVTIKNFIKRYFQLFLDRITGKNAIMTIHQFLDNVKKCK